MGVFFQYTCNYITEKNGRIITKRNYDDVMTCKLFPHCWSLVQGIHLIGGLRTQRASYACVDVFCYVSLNKLLNKWSMCHWLETSLCSCCDEMTVVQRDNHHHHHHHHQDYHIKHTVHIQPLVKLFTRAALYVTSTIFTINSCCCIISGYDNCCRQMWKKIIVAERQQFALSRTTLWLPKKLRQY